MSKPAPQRKKQSPTPSSELIHSPVDAWNPAPDAPPRLPSLEIIGEAPVKEEGEYQVIIWNDITVPLRNERATWKAMSEGYFHPLQPSDITGGNNALDQGLESLIVWGSKYYRNIETVVLDESPWEDLGKLYEPTEFGTRVLRRGDEVPWLKPTVLVEYESTSYRSEQQPRTERARAEEAIPVSPHSRMFGDEYVAL